MVAARLYLRAVLHFCMNSLRIAHMLHISFLGVVTKIGFINTKAFLTVRSYLVVSLIKIAHEDQKNALGNCKFSAYVV